MCNDADLKVQDARINNAAKLGLRSSLVVKCRLLVHRRELFAQHIKLQRRQFALRRLGLQGRPLIYGRNEGGKAVMEEREDTRNFSEWFQIARSYVCLALLLGHDFHPYFICDSWIYCSAPFLFQIIFLISLLTSLLPSFRRYTLQCLTKHKLIQLQQ